MVDSDDELLTMEEIVNELGKTRATIHKYMRQGMPFLKKGRNNFFKKSEALKWFWGQQMGDDYVEQTSKAQEIYPEDPLAQIAYIRNNSTKRTYATGMVEIMQRAFQLNTDTMSDEICLKAGLFDQLGRGMLFAIKQIPHSDDKDDKRFFYIANRIESFISAVIQQRHAYIYKEIPFVSFFGTEVMTREKYDREEAGFYCYDEQNMEFFTTLEGRPSDAYCRL
ncbi:MAG: helix-turn-helix domain-containing protein [Candidatus Desulfaltia sp.]|nr:helix-turn-helix domain-containing protein [Candidatus Desulfaltia sp.]